MAEARDVRVAIVGFGWIGQVHARSLRVLPTYLPAWEIRPRLTVVADPVPEQRQIAQTAYSAERVTDNWEEAVTADDVDVVIVGAPNRFHGKVTTAAAQAGKAVLCEKPVGETPEETLRIVEQIPTDAIVHGAGYNYRWAPPVQYLHQLLEEQRLGTINYYRGRFFAGYGTDRLGVLSWRYKRETSSFGVLTDLMCHAVDLALHLVGPIRRLVAVKETFVRNRPLPSRGGSHYAIGKPADATGRVTNEDYIAALVEFESGARGILESDRTMVGPHHEMAFDLSGDRGAAKWNLETMNELQLLLAEDAEPGGYRRLLSGEGFPHHPIFLPGRGLSLSWEHLKMIEDYEFLSRVVAGEPHRPSLEDAASVARVLKAMAESWESETWVVVDSA